MPLFDPERLAAWTQGRWTLRPAAAVTGFAHDTRTLRAGELFVALKTGRRDGHDFLGAAEAAGAAGALVARADPGRRLPQLVVADPLAALQAIARGHRRGFAGPVVGISGSVGKTSTKDLLALLLGGPASVLATEGNLNNFIGVPLTLTRLDPAVHRHAVIEAGISLPGEMSPLAAMIEPDLALITLVAPAHLQELGDLEGVAREKAALPAGLRPAGVAIFPRQVLQFAAFRDLTVHRMIVEPAEVVLPPDPEKDRIFFAISQRGESTAVTIVYPLPSARRRFTLQRVSAGMAQNAVLAICAALWLGVEPDLIQERLGRWQPAKWRGEVRREAGRMLYLDCYNANPISMADALDNFEGLAPEEEPRAYVLGCMEELGPGAGEFHRRLGRRFRLRPGDRLFVIGDHAAALVEGVREAGNRAGGIEVLRDLTGLPAFLAGFRGAVFVKGSRRYRLEEALAEHAPQESLAC